MTNRLVARMSSGLGVGSPDGWLCAVTAVALTLIAALNTSRGMMNAAFGVPGADLVPADDPAPRRQTQHAEDLDGLVLQQGPEERADVVRAGNRRPEANRLPIGSKLVAKHIRDVFQVGTSLVVRLTPARQKIARTRSCVVAQRERVEPSPRRTGFADTIADGEHCSGDIGIESNTHGASPWRMRADEAGETRTARPRIVRVESTAIDEKILG